MTWYTSFRAFFRLFFSVFFRWKIIGAENVPSQGPVIVCCNHISNFDPPLLGSSLERQVHYMAKEELFRVPVISFLVTKFGALPVKRGGSDRAAIRTTLKILEEGKMFGIFPEGTRSKTGKLGEGQSGVSLFALKSEAQVVPAAIIGPYKLFRPITIVFGHPIDLSHYRDEKASADTMKATTQRIMDEIQKLLDKHQQS